MSLYEELVEERTENVPDLIRVEYAGGIRFGDDDYGNTITSMDIRDNGQLPVDTLLPKKKQKELREGLKRLCFPTEELFKFYTEHEESNIEDKSFPIPNNIKPDHQNRYWVRFKATKNGSKKKEEAN